MDNLFTEMTRGVRLCVPLQALMSLFVLASKDGWVNIMYHGLDAVAIDQQVINERQKLPRLLAIGRESLMCVRTSVWRRQARAEVGRC